MKVADLMQTDVRTVYPESTLADVVGSLADGHVTALPVIDRHGKVLGVVSTADVMEAEAEALADGGAWEDRLVSDVMSRPALTIGPEADFRDAARQMLYADVHRLFVEEKQMLVGVISQSDIVRAVASRLV